MRKAFTLIELLVVIAIISVLMAIGLPVARRVREQGAETVCRSNLRQMALILKTYANDHDGFFPDPQYIYHSEESFSNRWREMYPACCRWHDARINLDSPLLCQEHPELQGSLVSYLGGPWIARCKTGIRANLERGCNNACGACVHDPNIAVVPQYTYSMNSYLHATISTGTSATGSFTGQVDPGPAEGRKSAKRPRLPAALPRSSPLASRTPGRSTSGGAAHRSEAAVGRSLQSQRHLWC
jgi:prepilin-type N-terminal cleavage/methylation domain-containing protein